MSNPKNVFKNWKMVTIDCNLIVSSLGRSALILRDGHKAWDMF